MKVYENLAPYYDRFMDHINYENEAESIYRFLFQVNKMNGRVLDVGAGSGGHLLPLLAMGVKGDGLDYAEGVRAILREKVKEGHLNAALYTADMRDFHTEHRYDVIYCFGETLRHLETIDDAEAFFRCAAKALKDGGYLIFTWKEKDYFHELEDWGDFYDRHGEDYLLWSSELKEEENAAFLSYTAFVTENGETYRRIRETHRLALFDSDEIYRATEKAGFAIRDDLEEICFDEIIGDAPFKHVTVLEKF